MTIKVWFWLLDDLSVNDDHCLGHSGESQEYKVYSKYSYKIQVTFSLKNTRNEDIDVTPRQMATFRHAFSMNFNTILNENVHLENVKILAFDVHFSKMD